MKKTKKIEKKLEDLLKELNPYCRKCDCDFYSSGDDPMIVRYCPNCGSSLVQPSLCLFCENPMNADAKYCTVCGVTAFRKDG